MTSAERVYAAIRHTDLDRVPWGELLIDDTVVESFLLCKKVDFEERLRFIKTLGIDLVCLTPKFADYESNVLPSPFYVRIEDIDKWAKNTNLFLFILLNGIVGWGTRLWGFKDFMLLLIKKNSLLNDFIKKVVALNIALATYGRDHGANGIIIADDIAYRRGLIMRPETVKGYLLPALKYQIDGIGRLNMPVFFHSDGNINDVLEDMANIGLSGLHGLEASSGMDILEIKVRFGNRLCLWGNLDPKYLTRPVEKKELYREIEPILIEGTKDGGLIFGTSSGLFKGVMPENLRMVYSFLQGSTVSNL